MVWKPIKTPWQQDTLIDHDKHRLQHHGAGWKCSCGRFTASQDTLTRHTLIDLLEDHMQLVQLDLHAPDIDL